MKHTCKSEALDKFKEFKAIAEKGSGMELKAVRTDKRGEYMSEEFASYSKQCGIQAETTAAYSPQQNGVAQRLNRTIGEATRPMTTTYLRKGMVTTALKTGCTPYQLWLERNLTWDTFAPLVEQPMPTFQTEAGES